MVIVYDCVLAFGALVNIVVYVSMGQASSQYSGSPCTSGKSFKLLNKEKFDISITDAGLKMLLS